jgi:hypothetical protein
MSKIMRYSSDFVLSLRPSKDQIISEKLSKHFDWINELFLESTQYQDNRKKINYNQINSQKWRSINNNVVNSVLLLLNSLDFSLYNEIESKICNISIKDINNMRKIIEIIHEKSCESYNSQNVLELYVNILLKLIENGKWYYKIGDKITDYICPRIVVVSIAQKNYCEMLDTFLIILDNYNKTQDEVSYFKVKNHKFIGNMLFIAKLYNKKIISTEIIDKICKDILNKVNEDVKNSDLVEYLLNMLQIIENYDNIQNIYDELYKIKDILPTRIKFLIMNNYDNYKNQQNKKEILNKNSEKKVIITKSIETYSNLLMEYIINESFTDFLESIKDKVEGDIVLSILRKYNPVCHDKLIKFVELILKHNIITKNEINEKITMYKENGELDDIIEECPIVIKFINKIQEN